MVVLPLVSVWLIIKTHTTLIFLIDLPFCPSSNCRVRRRRCCFSLLLFIIQGGAVENAKPARMLDEIRAAGETIPDECEVFNANVEMDADELKFEDVMDLIDKHYEVGLIEFKNGDIVNKQGENEGSAKLLSYAALAELDKDTTLKLWGQYYREVLADPKGDSHQNIRNFMKYGWDGTFSNSLFFHYNVCTFVSC